MFGGHKADIMIVDDAEFAEFEANLAKGKKPNPALDALLARTKPWQDKPARKFPSVGDSIAILHSVKRNSTGEVLGVHRADSVAVDTISAVYLDGTVRVGTSDTWEVKFASGESKATKGAKWATVNPMHGRG